MSNFEKIATALLVAIAVEGAVTTAEIVRIARDGFEVELTEEQLEVIEDEVSGAAEEAFEDMENEASE